MPKLLYTVDNLVAETRSMLDEANVDSIDTNTDILPALNRAQDYAFDVLARKYPEPILTYSYMNLSSGVAEYSIAEDVFEDRILKVEIRIPSGSGNDQFREIQRVSYNDMSEYETPGLSNMPYYYCIFGRTIRLSSAPTGNYGVRIWYLRNPEKLVLPQGRITIVNTASNYVIVDQAGSDLTTESDQLGSYVNLIDGQTGVIKGSLQIQILQDNKLAFRAVPLRSTVLNREIAGSITGLAVNADDYVCNVAGIAVPYYGQPTCNFMIQYAVSELTRKLGGNGQEQEQVLEKFEKQVERTWVKRENTTRIKKRSKIWGLPANRWWWTQS